MTASYPSVDRSPIDVAAAVDGAADLAAKAGSDRDHGCCAILGIVEFEIDGAADDAAP